MRIPTIKQMGNVKGRGLHRYVLGTGATRPARPLREAFLVAGGARKKTYGGRVRSAAPGAQRFARESWSCPARARGRCAAIPGCRKSRNAHRTTCETAAGARE